MALVYVRTLLAVIVLAPSLGEEPYLLGCTAYVCSGLPLVKLLSRFNSTCNLLIHSLFHYFFLCLFLVRSREAYLELPEYPEYETHAAPKGPAPEYQAALKAAAVRGPKIAYWPE